MKRRWRIGGKEMVRVARCARLGGVFVLVCHRDCARPNRAPFEALLQRESSATHFAHHISGAHLRGAEPGGADEPETLA